MILFLLASILGSAPATPEPTATRAKPSAAAREAGIEWIRIPGGSFIMGDENLCDPPAQRAMTRIFQSVKAFVTGEQYEGCVDAGACTAPTPAHRVTIKAFQMAKTLVTNRQYKACVDAGACTAPNDCGAGFRGDDQPVVCVDWNQAKAFSKWVGGRLPSEAEWEYAARSADKDWKYPWGNEKATCDKAVIGACANATMPVCSKPAGNTKQGLCDMAGNAWEWVQDWYHSSYQGAPTDGRAWENPAGSRRVTRGGSWGYDATGARAAFRSSDGPDNRGYRISLRPAR